MAHSNQIREFILTDHGAKLMDVAIGPAGVVTGSARLAQQALEASGAAEREQAGEAKRRTLVHKRTALQARLKALQAEFDAEAQALQLEIEQDRLREERAQAGRARLIQSRYSEGNPNKAAKGGGK